ncbi:hypothetical protein EGW08_002144 [Elysia chlorotica]|uniref:Major facilitator superfamily (MFS) profile domain-containing protein n=1 Tax=Elysia chlorotica TaxID=188477 RepID=A0A433U8G6_ELYCH|nr:hypothetical protein EGW08_002144 [Elysia chlorotica]
MTFVKDSKMEGGLRGLVIVFSAFMVQVLAFGNYACVGIFTVHFLEEFEGNAVGVSLISSIHFAVLLGFGPVTSFLMGLLSARKLCVVGAALVTIGIFCTPILVYLPAMYIFFGVFAGLGGCLIYLPSHVLSGLYYDKYRSLAVGVATAGQGMASILMPPVVGLLIEKFTWRGSLIILAGIDLHLFIFAILMIPPPDEKTAEQFKKLSQEENVDANTHGGENGSVFVSADALGKPDGASENRFLFDKVDVKCKYQPLWEAGRGDQSKCELVDCPDTPKSPSRRRLSSSSSVGTPRLERRPSKRLSAYLEGKIHRRQIPDDDISNIFIPSYYSWLPSYQANGVAATPIEEDINDAESGRLAEQNALVSREDRSGSRDLLAPTNQHRTVMDETKKHLAVLLNFNFIVYFISTLLWGMTTTLFVTFGPDFFVMKGHSDIDSAFVFTFYGVGQFFGCIFVSILGSFVGRRRMLLFIVANVLTGLLMGVVPFFSSFTEMAVMLVALGLVYGGILGLYMIVMVDIVGTEDMDIGLGYIMLGSGIGCFIGPPIGGAMMKAYGNYDLALYMSGVVTVLAGLIMLLVYNPCRHRKGEKQ